MGYLKQKQLEIEEHLSGSECTPALNGGYLYIYKGNNLLHIASIPSFNFSAENYRQSVVENDEVFKDSEGNEFSIEILSSNVGTDWSLIDYPKNDELIKKIKYEVKINDY